MNLNAAAGLAGMLKDGHRHIEGVDDALLRNIEACQQLSDMVVSSMGPLGRNKLVVNHLGKIIVTSDCATMLKELEVEHPAAKMVQMASTTQDQECGDATNLVVSFAGELLKYAEELLRMGLHTSDIVFGYEQGFQKLIELLPTLVVDTMSKDVRQEREKLIDILLPVVGAKQYGTHEILAPLVVDACLGTMRNSTSMSVESVRVCKILGGSVEHSHVIQGYVAQRGVETTITQVSNAKITVFGCSIEASSTEAKGTVLMKNAEDLKGYNVSEERKMEEIIKSIADTGCNVVVTGGSVSDMAMHFLDRYKLMCLKIGSKWELRRCCTAINATALVRLGPATPDEMGYCDSVKTKELGGKKVTIFDAQTNDSRLATIVLRASTSTVLQDLERAIDDGVHAVRMATIDGRLVAGAGAAEMELALQLKKYGDTCPGLEQYAIRHMSKALELVPQTLAHNAGLDAQKVTSALTAAHAKGQASAGINVEDGGIQEETPIKDLLVTKQSALRLAVDAALTVLRVDQIIMSKPSGGGKQMQG